MVKKLPFIAILILFALSSCKKVESIVSDLLTVEVTMNQEISFDAKGLIPSDFPPGLIDLVPDTSIMATELPEISKDYAFNIDSTIRVETNNQFSLSNLKSAKFQQVKFLLPYNTKIDSSNIDTIRINAIVNDGSAPYKVEQFNNFTITEDPVNKVKNLYLSTLDTERDVINQLKASSVKYSIYAKFKDSIPVRFKDQYKLVITYKLTVKK